MQERDVQERGGMSHGDVSLGVLYLVGTLIGPVLFLCGVLGLVFTQLPVSSTAKYLIMGVIVVLFAFLAYVFSSHFTRPSRQKGEDQ